MSQNKHSYTTDIKNKSLWIEQFSGQSLSKGYMLPQEKSRVGGIWKVQSILRLLLVIFTFESDLCPLAIRRNTTALFLHTFDIDNA
jgi:hypothetical protein